MQNENSVLPILPLRGITIFPDMLMHFDVKREKSIAALEYAMENGQLIFMVTQKDSLLEEPDSINDFYVHGTITRVKQLVKLPKDIVRVLVIGESRGRLSALKQEEPFMIADIEKIDEVHEQLEPYENEALLYTAREIIQEYVKANDVFPKDLIPRIIAINEPGSMADAIGFHLVPSIDNKQNILKTSNKIERLKLAMTILDTETQIINIRNNINQQVKARIDKSQKEYYLREQIKVIQNELGDGQSTEDEIEELLSRTKQLNAPQEVLDRIEKEIKRFKKIPMGSSESVVSRNYIEWLLDLPWLNKTEESVDLETAEKILNEDHYGLEQVKERVLEHLAVRKLSSKTDSPIICLVGPPGTGKTSIAKSIARALNRKYSRISLGGVRDEAEIRGHRRTYVGAMPGRLVNALKYAESSNPLILLDEVDKMSSDFRGDPSSALLEVLDSQQNNKFRDHYIEIPLDLSDVLFVATANSIRNIPKPLLDRLEIIEVNSYTDNEKLHIANSFLIPKQREKHGLLENQLVISNSCILSIISEYTKEAGVRSLERKIGEICRKAAREIYSHKKNSIRVTDKNLKQYLGIPQYRIKKANEKPQIGVARGLAWTEVGGDTLSVEVNIMNGTGKFELTGQLGDVMKESAKAAISFIRSQADEIQNIPKDFYKKKDIHIHIPEGAVPKDGPSAGVTMALAMISALTQQPVSNEVAMTGEITLRGRVLPVGGLKEKLLAAKRAGIKKVLVPLANKRNIEEISKEITKGLEIVYISEMVEVLNEALLKEIEV